MRVPSAAKTIVAGEGSRGIAGRNKTCISSIGMANEHAIELQFLSVTSVLC